MEEAGEEAEAEDGADDDLKTRTPHNDVKGSVCKKHLCVKGSLCKRLCV